MVKILNFFFCYLSFLSENETVTVLLRYTISFVIRDTGALVF